MNENPAEKLISDIEDGKLKLENIEVEWGDILSFEIGVVYTNINPPFVLPGGDIGGGVIGKKVRIIEHSHNPYLLDFMQNFLVKFPNLSTVFLPFIRR